MTYIYGKHAVTEALRNLPEAVQKVFLLPSFADDVIRDLLAKNNIKSEKMEINKMPKEVDREVTHQGVIALVSLHKLVKPYKEFIENLKVTPHTALIILGELQDPQNVGAVIRSAAAFGIAGVLIPEYNQAPINGTVVKVSAGMAFRVPLVEISNINNTIRDLKEKGFWIYGLDGEAEHSLNTEKFDAPTVFILGNEAKGIREKTKELCDIVLKIPSDPRCESLNAAASAAVAMYAWSREHPII